MSKAIYLAVFAGGLLLVILGINVYNSTSSDVSRFFTGAATDKAIWMLAGGAALIVGGFTGLIRGSKAI